MEDDSSGDTEALLQFLVRRSEFTTHLLKRRFSDYQFVMQPPITPLSSHSRGRTVDREYLQRRRAEIETYRAELDAKPVAELKAMHDELLEQERRELQARLDREEQARVFNQPQSRADFDYWARATYWKLDEAIALSFGKAPELVNWTVIEKFVHISPFAKQYARRRELAIRAKNFNQLYDPVVPTLFLAWARRTGIEIPAELLQAVESLGVVIADWKELFDKAKASRDALAEECEQLAAANSTLVDRCTAAEAALAQLRASAWEGFDASAENYPYELDIAMVVWRAVSNSASDEKGTVKQRIQAWLETHYPDLSDEARKRIAVICNWEKSAGRRKAD